MTTDNGSLPKDICILPENAAPDTIGLSNLQATQMGSKRIYAV